MAAIAPPGCASCRRALTRASERLCPECTLALPWLRGGCPRCGLPRHRGRGCPAAHAAFGRAWAPLAYEGVARDLVAALKFRAALPVADVMAAHIAATLPRRCAGRSIALVPVPAAGPRRRARGFDPARTLATALARRIDRPLTDCLVRADRSSPPGRREPRGPPRTGPPARPRARLPTGTRPARRRRPHDRRHARRLRPRARRRRPSDGRGSDQLRADAVKGGPTPAGGARPRAARVRASGAGRRAAQRPDAPRGEAARRGQLTGRGQVRRDVGSSTPPGSAGGPGRGYAMTRLASSAHSIAER